jgi:hypothetical protein
MLATQVTELTLGGRFSGPPATANGGYACGTIAELLGGDVEVTLRRPPPLGRPLRLRVGDGDAVVHHGDQLPVPAQQRVGLDEEARPAGSGEDAADRGEQGAVGGLQPRAWNLAAQQAELVAQEEDLQVLAGVVAAELGEQLDRVAQRQVGEFRQHQVGRYMDEELQGAES